MKRPGDSGEPVRGRCFIPIEVAIIGVLVVAHDLFGENVALVMVILRLACATTVAFSSLLLITTVPLAASTGSCTRETFNVAASLGSVSFAIAAGHSCYSYN